MTPPERLMSYFLDDGLDPDDTAALVDMTSEESRSSGELMCVHLMCEELLTHDEPSGAAVDLAVAAALRHDPVSRAFEEEIMETTSQPCRGVDSGGEAPEPSGRLTAPAPEPFSLWLQRRLGATPWWMISVTLHAVLLFLAMLIVVSRRDPPGEINITRVDFRKFEQKIDIPEERRNIIYRKVTIDPIRGPIDLKAMDMMKQEMVPDETDDVDPLTPELVRGDPDMVSRIPSDSKTRGRLSPFGVGREGGGTWGRQRLSRRRRLSMVRKYCENSKSEDAVVLGLKWLAAHQEADGSWDASRWGAASDNAAVDEGVTGLALLAFLGAGHTDRHGDFRDNVKRALKWALASQQADGFLGTRGQHPGDGYNHAILGLALAEAYGLTRNRKVGDAAQKAVNWSCLKHQHITKDGDYLAWRYSKGSYPDTSVTGWFVMQLKAAKVGGLTVPGHGFLGAMNWLDLVQPMPKADADVYGGSAGRAVYMPGREPNPRITTVAMLCRQFLDFKPKNPVLVGAANYVLDGKLPRIDKSGTEFYYVYYGTLAMFQMGGDYWARWNDHFLDRLVKAQVTDPGDQQGSWNPGRNYYARNGGRVYSTAMAVLSLEVFYRYLRMYN